MSRRRRGHHGRHRGRSMVARVFVLLVVGLLLSAALTGVIGWRQMRTSGIWGTPAIDPVASRIAAFIRLYEGTAPAARAPLVELGRGAGLVVLDRPEDVEIRGRTLPALADALGRVLGRSVRAHEGFGPRQCAEEARGWPSAWHCYSVRTVLADGAPVLVHVTYSGASAPRLTELRERPPLLAGWMLLLVFLAALLVLAAVITRVALAPLSTLSRAAQTFGDDVEAPPLAERGPREIRTALAAFNRMQSRIRAHLVERTSMLAAIAHDLQTPLTRLRLRLEQVDDPALRGRLEEDLRECQARVREGLDLARSLDDASPIVDVDLDALLATACDEAADAGQPVRYDGPTDIVVRARPQALARSVENLIVNAVKYGGEARVSAVRDGANALIRVRDRGPGIPPPELERVFEPFVRLEQSRSRATGGTGLGLYIVRNLMRRQNGEVTLVNLAGADGPGLEARLSIPLA